MDVYRDNTGKLGSGLFVSRDFGMGETVFLATGEVIAEQTMYSIQIGWERHLDADAPFRFINHSCRPDVGPVMTAAGLTFVALRDIRAGEEIRYDYAMTEFRHYPRANPADEFDLTCHCGEPTCRGRLGYYSELPARLKEAYRGFILSYLVLSEDPALSISQIDFRNENEITVDASCLLRRCFLWRFIGEILYNSCISPHTIQRE